MPTFQMAILCLFENVDSLTGNEIQELLAFDCDKLSKHVAPLVESNLLISNTQVILYFIQIFTYKLNLKIIKRFFMEKGRICILDREK